MAPFLCSETLTILYALLSRFMKDDELKKATTHNSVAKIQPNDDKLWCNVSDVDIGVAASKYLHKAVAKKIYLMINENLSL